MQQGLTAKGKESTKAAAMNMSEAAPQACKDTTAEQSV
jgi:hypothetical protein